MNIRKIIHDFASNIQKLSVRKIAAVIGVLVAGMYVLLFVVPRPVAFSYAGDTCVGQLVLFPDVQRTNSEAFSLQYSGGFSVGKTHVTATRLCFTPKVAPAEGSTTVAAAPWGWYVFRAHYKLTVPESPKILASTTKAPIAVTKPVVYSIDQTDTIFSYKLTAADKTDDCTVKNTTVNCSLEKLALTQGAEHTLTLTRSFKGINTKKILTTTVSILPAVVVADSSVKNGQVIYDKPASFSFTTDKKLLAAAARLVQVDGDKETDITTTSSVKDTAVTVAFAGELPREKSFRLTLSKAEAEDGSTTSESFVVSFTTSGGSKVTGVNVGTSGVDPNARIVVTFDQPIADTVDITKFARVTGVSAAVSKQGSQIVFSLQNAARCSAFTIAIDKGITSATNGLASKDGWSYNSRVNCRATVVIGYSVKGRAIIAYYYGSGATTILFTGGMHGSEPSGYSTMLAWATYLDTNADKIPAGRQIVIVPNTNPDGIAAGTRLNSRGVNIDRNFATSDWKTDIDTSSGKIAGGGGGSSPMSEPETQAIGALTLQLNPRLEVSFHASGRLVGANDVADSRSLGSLYASTIGYSTMFGGSAEEVMGYSFSGQYEDYIGQKLGRPAILIELPTAGGNYLNSQLNALWKMVSS